MNLVSLWLSLGERLVPILLDLLNRSRAVFLLLLAAVLLRFLFYWGPKRVRCLMWALVALRLLLPLHLTSSLSVLGGSGIPVSEAGHVPSDGLALLELLAPEMHEHGIRVRPGLDGGKRPV